MSKKLLTELRSFAETTSVRGIPRVMKAKTRVTFFVWLVAVLTCAALLVWQLSVVLMRYFQYPVNTFTVQAPASQYPTFPDITICNLNPNIYPETRANWFHEGANANDLIAWLNRSFSYTVNESCIIIDATDYADWFQEMYSVQISDAWNPTYYTCFTLRPQTENIRSLTALLYVDQVNEVASDVYDYYRPDEVTGLSMLVHAPGTAPDMTLGVNLVPGTTTNIQLTQSVRTRLGQPYSNCTNQQHLLWDNTSDVYTQPYCVNTCIQQKFIEQCGCVSARAPQYTMAQLRKVNYRICEILTELESDLQAVNFSLLNVSSYFSYAYSEMATTCSVVCVLPCSEFQYDAAVSVAPWPSSNYLTQCSNYVLSNLRFLHLFMNISANATFEEIYAATTTSAATDFFKSRFLKLNVEFGTQSFIELKDVAAFSADTMGAQIGGVLSLWLGVIVMFAFEAFEFIYVYLTNSRKEEPKQTGSTSTTPSAETELSQSVVVEIEYL